MTPILIIILLILPPLIFAITNLIDKYLTKGDEIDSGPSVLMTTGGLFNIIVSVLILIYILVWSNFDVSWPLFFNGILFSIGIWIYLYLIRNEEINSVIVWYQFIPVFGLIGGALILKEYFGVWELYGIFLLIFGSLAIGYRKGKFNKKLVWLGLISALLIAINDVVFAEYGRQINLSSALFWDTLGKGAWGFLFLLSRKVRKGFFLTIRTKFKIQSSNEMLYIVGDGLFDVAKIYAPVAIVQAFAASQPMFVFIGDWVMSKLKPGLLGGEVLKSRSSIIIYIIIVVAGGVIVGMSL